MKEFFNLLDNLGVSYSVKGNKILIEGDLDLRGTGITSLPDNLSVGGWLDLEGTGITSLPDNLSVGGGLDLEGTGITSLPDNLSVGGWLNLRGTGITSLPDNLSVGGGLDLRGTGITSLPDNLSVGGGLDLDIDKVKNIAYQRNCGYSSRTIFAAWIDNTFKIKAGCFLGDINEFEKAVDESYSGNASEAYKQVARNCIAELTVKLNKQQ